MSLYTSKHAGVVVASSSDEPLQLCNPLHVLIDILLTALLAPCCPRCGFWFAGDVEVSKIIVNETKLFKVTVSFGNVVSLISLPCYMSHASIPAEVRAARGLPDDLVRISAGIEDSQDLIADLSRAMDLAAQHLAKKQAAAAAASGNGVGSGAAAAAVAAAAGREQELLERVRSLEEQLAGLKGLLTLGPVSNGKAPASH
jgi:hypothetical protein